MFRLIPRLSALFAMIVLPTMIMGAETRASAPVSAAVGNPIRLGSSTADPGVVRLDGKWYVYCTSSGSRYKNRYPIYVSPNLTSWTAVGYIFPQGHSPVWAKKSTSWWAPEVHRVESGYIAYFTTREDSTNRFVVGAAVAKSPTGPFIDIGHPLVRNESVGLIDVTYFRDPNTDRKFLIWKEDGNDFDPPHPTPLMMQELTPDGLHLVGDAKELIHNDQPWEGVLVEAPSLIYRKGWYYLLYSGNVFTEDAYSVGVARSRKVWGPYEKNPSRILTSDADFSGPAHQFAIQDEKGVWHLFYHARLKALERPFRFLMHDYLGFNEAGWPVVNNGHPGPLSQKAKELISKDRKRRKQSAAKK